jgi:Rrf2 family cysteine metabolism transcriptional repressor
MLLSKRTQYGIRALVCFADAYERGFLQAKELSKREKLPAKFLETILNTLVQGNLLESKIGAQGGYRLARAPKEIMLGEIVSRLQGRRAVKKHRGEPANERPGEFAIRLIQTQLSEALTRFLDSTSLAELADQVAQHNRAGQMYFI